MKNGNRRRYGPRAVLVAIFLAALLAGLVAVRFAYRLPSTNDAHLLFKGQVLATMNPRIAANIQEGMTATVTIEGFESEKFTGIVEVVDQPNDRETNLMIQLRNPPEDATPRASCSVTVDTSSPPVSLK